MNHRPGILALLLCGLLAAADPAPQGTRIAATDAGPVTVPPATDALPDAAAHLAELVRKATTAGLRSRPWTLRRGLLTGWHLRGDDALVLAGAVLRREAAAAIAADDRRQALERAVEAARTAVAADLPPVSADAVRALLGRLTGATDTDGLPPAVARRLAASPWLDGLIDAAAATRLRQALAAAGPRPTEAFTDGSTRLERHDDAFGGQVWILRAPGRCAYAMPVEGPAWRHHLPWTLTVELPADADPWRDAARATAAAIFWSDHELARWDGNAVTADPDRWRAGLAPWGKDLEPGWPAQHLVLTAPDGTVLRLLVGRTALAAPQDGGDPGFLERAAAALPTPALLPLVGDTFFTYAHDSPDPAHPRLVGDAQRHGDVHQTADQTLATTLGGRFRGDCDDLAELYTALLACQGRLTHVMDLGDHAAAGWLEHTRDAWRMHVLHSGPAHCYTAATGPEAVVAAYQALGERKMPYRADQIAVLLRFAGENTRSPWRLSWRIYDDTRYARTMIDVQRDWYFRTYHRGVATMQALIAAGDGDPANHSELSGLYRRIGDWERSIAEFHSAASLRGGEPTPYDRLELLRLLCLAGNAAAVRTEAAMLAERIAALAATQPVPAIELACTLIANLDGDAFAPLRAELSLRLVEPWFRQAEPGVRSWIADRFDAATWGSDRFAAAFRLAGGTLAANRIAPWTAAARDRRPPPTDGDRSFLDWWYDEVCTLPRGADSRPTATIIPAAAWLSLRIGPQRMAALVAKARLPTGWDGKRIDCTGPLGAGTVAAWAAASLPWIEHDMRRVAATSAGTERSAAVAGLLALLTNARPHIAAHGLADSRTEATADRIRLLAALVEGDRAGLDASFAGLVSRHDRAELESTAGLIGAWAKHLGDGPFAIAIERWFAIVDERHLALEIAWRALHATAWDGALAAARAAAARHPEDPELGAEAGRIAALVAERRLTTPERRSEDQIWVP